MAKSAGEILKDNIAQEPPETDAASPAETPAEPKRRKRAAAQDETPAEPAPEPETTPEPTPEPQPEPVAEVPQWKQRLTSELGFENVDSDDVYDRLVEYAAQQRRDAEELEAWRRQNEPFVGYGREYIATRPQQTEQKAAEKPKPWQPPVTMPEVPEKYLVRTEAGEVDWKPDAPADLRSQYDKFESWRAGMLELIAKRPDRFISEVIVPLIDERSKSVVEPFYEQRTAEQQRVSYEQKFIEQNAAWLYATDPATQRPITGTYSQVGQAFVETYNALLSKGHSPQEAIEYAQYRVGKQTGVEPWKPVEKTPAELRDENKRKHNRKPLNGAGSVPDRSGSFTEPEEGLPQNGNLSAGRRLLDRAKREGVRMPWEAVPAGTAS